MALPASASTTIIALATEGERGLRLGALLKAGREHVVSVPVSADFVTPVLRAVPMQLLACHIAVRRGFDVEQLRNLAKSVAVDLPGGG